MFQRPVVKIEAWQILGKSALPKEEAEESEGNPMVPSQKA